MVQGNNLKIIICHKEGFWTTTRVNVYLAEGIEAGEGSVVGIEAGGGSAGSPPQWCGW